MCKNFYEHVFSSQKYSSQTQKKKKKTFKMPIIHHDSNIYSKTLFFPHSYIENKPFINEDGNKSMNLNKWWRCENQKRKCEMRMKRKGVLFLWGEAIEKRWRKHINENV